MKAQELLPNCKRPFVPILLPVPTQNCEHQESLGIFLCDRRTVGRHDHYSICSRVRALVPVSQPGVAGTRACRPATSANRLAAATPSPPPASFRALAALWSSLRATPRPSLLRPCTVPNRWSVRLSRSWDWLRFVLAFLAGRISRAYV